MRVLQGAVWISSSPDVPCMESVLTSHGIGGKDVCVYMCVFDYDGQEITRSSV